MRKIININQNWLFYKGVSEITPEVTGEAISLPHTWNNLDGQDGGGDYFRGTCLQEKVLVKSENKNSYDIAIENAINSDKEYVIDMSGNYYSVDHMTNTIENNPFEKMDAYQIYEYVKFDNKIAIILTSNEEQKLKNKEIIDNLIGFFY